MALHITHLARASFASVSLIALSTALAPTIAHAQDDTTSFDISAQSLGDALDAFGTQSGLQIAVAEESVAGVDAPGIRGDLTADDALAALLADTGLTFQFVNETTVVVSVDDARDEPFMQLVDEEPEVIRVRGFRGALAEALETKRERNQLSDLLVAEEFGKFPDLNVTDALARISGVQISRQSGEGETANVRGLSSGFARVEIDGRKFSATRDNNTPERGSVLTQFSTELFDSVEVIKTPKASDVEGGIGGIVRLNTPDPLDIGEFAFGLELSATEGDQYDFTQTNLNGFVNNVYMDGRLGVLASFVVRHDDNALSRTTGRRSPDLVGQTNNFGDNYPELAPFADALVMSRIGYDDIAGDEENYNFNAKVQFQPTETLELYIGGTYSFEDRTLNESSIGVNPENGVLAPLSAAYPDATDPIIVNGENAVVQAAWENGRLTIGNDYNVLENTIYNYNFGAKWDVSERFRVKFDAAWSSSEETRENFRVNGLVTGVTAGYSLLEDAEYPVVTVVDFDQQVEELLGRRWEELRRFDRRVAEDDMAVRFDAEYDVDLPGITSFEAGFRFASIETQRLRTRVRHPLRRDGSFTYGDVFPNAAQTNPVGAFFGGEAPAGAITNWPSANGAVVWNLAQEIELASTCAADFFNLECAGVSNVSWEPPRSTEEESWAYYAMANYDWANDWVYARGNIGLRVVNTTTSGQGIIDIERNVFQTNPDGELVNDGDPIEETQVLDLSQSPLEADTTNFLPSWNFVFSRSEESDFLIRGGITRTETRPNYSFIVPNLEIQENVLDGEVVVERVNLPIEVAEGAEPDSRSIAASSLSSGNPAIDPYLAWQYDIGFEWYFGQTGEGLLTAAYFYKDLDDVFFEDTNRDVRTITFEGIDYTVGESSQPFNGGDAVIEGVEIGFQTPLSFLPGFWQDFGVFGNYTYLIQSEFTPIELATDESGDQVEIELPVQPFFDASEHTYNIAAYYERGGFSSRLAYNYRDEHRRDDTEYVDGFGRLDFAARYRFENGVRLSFDALNITEEERITYHSLDDEFPPVRSQPTLRDYEPTIYQFGIGFTF